MGPLLSWLGFWPRNMQTVSEGPLQQSHSCVYRTYSGGVVLLMSFLPRSTSHMTFVNKEQLGQLCCSVQLSELQLRGRLQPRTLDTSSAASPVLVAGVKDHVAFQWALYRPSSFLVVLRLLNTGSRCSTEVSVVFTQNPSVAWPPSAFIINHST